MGSCTEHKFSYNCYVITDYHVIQIFYIFLLPLSQPSKFTSAVGNCRGFCRGKQCFNSDHLNKYIAEVIIPSKIYIQFTIFNTYFSTKFLFTDKRCHLHVLEKCLYVLQKVRSIIYFLQFIHPLSLRSRSSETNFAFPSYIILSTKFFKNVTKVTF